jgi:hypothetical protein
MNFKTILTGLVFIIAMVGCKSKSAFNYSEDIIKKERSLIPEITATEKRVEKYIEIEQYDSIAIAGAKMEKLVQQKIDEIKSMKMPKVKEADNFRMATLRYFDYIKSMYTGYKDLGNAATTEAREKVLDGLRKIINGKQAAINDMQAVQRKFASANGFKVK